ncbi:DR2241 family protein [Roseibacillus persicicus]|uniref:DR2241 family protein n=1 Tax=Roseibacillus persicicus TaxID=454148 RepID=UPI00280F03E0|nr:DR2241 family protein [Roseibacillus persicicus]MDQ8190626.1 DR2241 family protein [Roseibacillus persicicus]
MKISQRLSQAVQAKVDRIGQVAILTNTQGSPYALCHQQDLDLIDSLTVHRDPFAAREIAKLDEEGEFRFLKAALNLKRGWLLLLADEEELRQALDLFYPAAVSLWLAREDGRLHVQNLRPKLKRQTGMYRFAHTISDEGVQALVAKECHPENCSKMILWHLDEEIPLKESPALCKEENQSARQIPLLCEEACNHLVSQCRKVAKAEADQAKAL